MIKIVDLNQSQLNVLNGKRCPYCHSETKEMTEKEIYGQEYKGTKMVACVNYPRCCSYVGTHKESGLPLGRLADHELRIARKEAHQVFDRLWQLAHMKRQDCYKELSEQLDLEPELTHFAYFSKETCLKAKNWAVIRLMSFDNICKHENVKRTDGLDECLDCGASNY